MSLKKGSQRNCKKCGKPMTVYSTITNTCFDCIKETTERGGQYKQRYGNKYGAKKSEFNGKRYDSRFEASVAAELEISKKAGEILDYDTQYRVDMWTYRSDGGKAFLVRHKVDFRVHKLDGSFKLLEAKGVETSDYRFRRNILVDIWLPDHLDYEYEVVKQGR